MSYRLLHSDGLVLYEGLNRVRIPLTTSRNAYIPPLSLARIEHGCRLVRQENPIIFKLRDPGVGLERALIVDQGLVDDGPLETLVFNISEERVLIPKGEIICWLMEI